MELGKVLVRVGTSENLNLMLTLGQGIRQAPSEQALRFRRGGRLGVTSKTRAMIALASFAIRVLREFWVRRLDWLLAIPT